MSTFTRTFWAETFERALKTFAQVLLALWGTGQALDPDGTGAPGALFVITDWQGALLSALVAAAISVLMSLASGKAHVGAAGSPSLVETSGRHAA
jgi:hypothetical protein